MSQDTVGDLGLRDKVVLITGGGGGFGGFSGGGGGRRRRHAHPIRRRRVAEVSFRGVALSRKIAFIDGQISKVRFGARSQAFQRDWIRD